MPNYRARLNEVCQKNSYVLKPEYVEDHSTGQPTFKCTMTCLLQGRKIVEDSGRKYYPRKDDAKETVAKKVLERIQSMTSSGASSTTAPNTAAPRGAAPITPAFRTAAVSVPPGIPPNMIWKSKLKEYYDKQGKPGTPIKYTVTQTPNGFVANVFIPELGAWIKGECGKNKKEAEQNAAKMALGKLQH